MSDRGARASLTRSPQSVGSDSSLAGSACRDSFVWLTALSGSPTYLIAVQVFGGVGTGLFAALTPLWLADATRGTGRYNFSQGAMATMRGLGTTTSAW